MRLLFIISLLITAVFFQNSTFSQIKGKDIPDFNPDTVFIYQSPRALIDKEKLSGEIDQAWGVDLFISDNGFGIGVFYQKRFYDDWFAFSSIYFSGARNSDEYELYDQLKNQYVVPGKINRLFVFPVSLGIQRYLFRSILSDNIKPFVNIGLGPSLILKAPYENYENSPFTSYKYTKLFTRFGAFLGTGVNVGSGVNSLISVNIRYYYIPFGGEGLESVRNSPIRDFGGVFISLSLGAKF